MNGPQIMRHPGSYPTPVAAKPTADRTLADATALAKAYAKRKKRQARNRALALRGGFGANA